MKIETNIVLLEDILSSWKNKIGGDYQGYRNHVYRMLNFCFYLYTPNEDELTKLVIAAAFHDLGIWSNDTLDYLPPSVAQAQGYLEQNELSGWVEEISLMIDLHHKLTPVSNDKFPLIEVFRRADLVDFSLGTINQGVAKPYIYEVKQAFPNASFHKRLLQLAWRRFKRRPLNPLPMMKW